MKQNFIFSFSLTQIIFLHSLLAQQVPIPSLKNENGKTTWLLDGAPFIMIGGELHNSSSSTISYFEKALDNARAMNVNTVLASIAWEQFEPQEGVFDYALIRQMIQQAEARKLKMVVLWFASWKNGESSYTPLWVKKDTKRFFHIRNKVGEEISALSPFCTEAMNADTRAFAELMKEIKRTDIHRTVVMVQPENEVGAFSDMDYNEVAIQQYREQVPTVLLNYLTEHKNEVESELKNAWQVHGNRTSGTWAEVFGEENANAQNFFMSWQYARYIQTIAEKGKAVYPLPMYVNAWLVQYENEPPGKFPNGGPVSRVMDIYRVAAPSIDFISPDIYLPTFKAVCKQYHRPQKNNPLFIPECERTNPGKAYYAVAEHGAIGFAPFGIESLVSDASYSLSFKLLNDWLPLIKKQTSRDTMHGILKESEKDSTILEMGDYKINITYPTKNKNAYGFIIKTASDEFLIAGINLKISFSNLHTQRKTYIGQVLEGEYKKGTWQTYRQLNGDETWHNTFVFATGRSYSAKKINNRWEFTSLLAPIPVLKQELESNLSIQQVEAPSLYKVKLYNVSQD